MAIIIFRPDALLRLRKAGGGGGGEASKIRFQGGRSWGFWVEPEPFLLSDSYSSYSTVKHVIFSGNLGGNLNFVFTFVSLRTVM